MPFAYRDTVVACVREFIRWGFVESVPLGDDEASFERNREAIVRATEEGRRIAALTTSERRELIGHRLIGTYLLFQELLQILERHDFHLPEFPDSVMKGFFPSTEDVAGDTAGWNRVATGCRAFLAWQGGTASIVRRGSLPTEEEIAAGVGAYLERRFSKRKPKDIREVTGAVNKALAAIFLHKLGFSGELNSYERCLRWGSDLYLVNDGRHVFGVPGWLAWPAAEIQKHEGAWSFERRGVSQHRQEVKRALVEAYRRIADARRTIGIQVPLIPIYEVRETAAFLCRVCDEVVDRVLGDLAFRRDSVGNVVVQLQIADARDFVPSARPFVYEGSRYFYVTMDDNQMA